MEIAAPPGLTPPTGANALCARGHTQTHFRDLPRLSLPTQMRRPSSPTLRARPSKASARASVRVCLCYSVR